MRVLILGAGVIGVTSAYYLARAGHEVTVIDRQPDVALETSFANAGQISPGYAAPWSGPGLPLKAIKWLMQAHPPLAIKPDGSWFQIRWLAQLLNHCTLSHYAENKARMVRLAEYSRDCLDTLREQTGIAYEGRQQGTLQVFRTQQQLDASARDMAVLQRLGVPYALLTREALVQAEPALAYTAHKLSGGLRLPHDETGDCHLFTQRLKPLAEKLGVKFVFNRHIDHLLVEGVTVKGAVSQGEVWRADACVVALASYSTALLKKWIRIPVYPIKGFSLTLPIKEADRAPISTVLDESYKVAITRFDQRIRVGGMANLVGFDLSLNPRRKQTLEYVVEDLFPQCSDVQQASFWCGLRPMTPDGTPLIGPTPLTGLWLNTGHGTLGWTMACGSAAVLTSLISGTPPEIQSNDLSFARYLS